MASRSGGGPKIQIGGRPKPGPWNEFNKPKIKKEPVFKKSPEGQKLKTKKLTEAAEKNYYNYFKGITKQMESKNPALLNKSTRVPGKKVANNSDLQAKKFVVKSGAIGAAIIAAGVAVRELKKIKKNMEKKAKVKYGKNLTTEQKRKLLKKHGRERK